MDFIINFLDINILSTNHVVCEIPKTTEIPKNVKIA